MKLKDQIFVLTLLIGSLCTPAFAQTPPQVSLGVGIGYCGPALCIQGVQAGGAAERAGLRAGDILRRIDTAEIGTVADVLAAVRAAKVGDRWSLTVRRGDQHIELALEFTSADIGGPIAEAASALSVPPPQHPFEVLPVPNDGSVLASRLGSQDSAVWIENDVLSIVHRDTREDVHITGTFQMPMRRIAGSDLWVLQLEMKGWDKAFFSYAFYSSSSASSYPRSTDFAVFRAPRAPALMDGSTRLKGRLQQQTLRSEHLREERAVTVYLPPGPRTGLLPVVFMADGQSTFMYAQMVERLIESRRIAPIAIVGVHAALSPPQTSGQYDATLDRRATEYVSIVKPEVAARHMRFFVEEVLPWATKEFELSPQRAARSVFGTSNGASFAFDAGIQHADLFAHVIAVSQAHPMASGPPAVQLPRFHFAAGSLEPPFRSGTERAHAIVKDWNAESTLTIYCSGHDPVMWKLALAQVLTAVFPAPR